MAKMSIMLLYFSKNPNKKFLGYRRCATHARFVAVSYWDFHCMIPRHNEEGASPSPGVPFHAPRAPLPPALFLSTISPTAAESYITRRQSSLRYRRHSLQCHLRGPCSSGQMEGGPSRAGTIGFADRHGVRVLIKTYGVGVLW